jgi:iron complex transport system permease protein
MQSSKYAKERKKLTLLLSSFGGLLILLFVISMWAGRYPIALHHVLGFFLGNEIPEMSARVILNLRMPRTLLAALIGAALSVSGAIYQSAFHNKLVSPDLLGVSSGASVGACLAILLGLSGAIVSTFSFLLGFTTVLITVLIARAFGNRSNVILLLSGIAVGGLMSSFIGLLKYLADDEMKLAEMTYWLLGDISGATMGDVLVMLPITIISSAVAILFAWRLNVLSLGEKEARALGVNYKATMAVLIAVATLLTAGAVSVSGTIGWVGLVIPNIVRLFVGSDNRKVIPVSLLGGAAYMMIVDMLARSLAPNEIPLSVITGIIGTPLFLLSIFKRRKELL